MTPQSSPPDDPRHGTYSAYTAGCHCDRCRAASTQYMREYRAGRRRRGDVLREPLPKNTPVDHRPDADGRLLVSCRCGRDFRRTPVELVRDRDWAGFECARCKEAA